MRPSARQFGQVQTIAESRARSASTVFFLHLKHLSAAGGCPVALVAWATTSTWNCAMVRPGPLVGPIAPPSSRKCLRSVMSSRVGLLLCKQAASHRVPRSKARCHHAYSFRLRGCINMVRMTAREATNGRTRKEQSFIRRGSQASRLQPWPATQVAGRGQSSAYPSQSRHGRRDAIQTSDAPWSE